MTERPIIFSQPMIRGLRADRKTQTRRAVKPPVESKPIKHMEGGAFFRCVNEKDVWVPCPYGVPGDQLWVKETHYRFGRWARQGRTAMGQPRWCFRPYGEQVAYLDNPPESVKTKRSHLAGWYKRPSIFMPRWASRLQLEITKVRVERLGEISEADARAEGIFKTPWTRTLGHGWTSDTGQPVSDTAVRAFVDLWASINGAWLPDTWVWVVAFKRLNAQKQRETS